jgi:hypothetical protein
MMKTVGMLVGIPFLAFGLVAWAGARGQAASLSNGGFESSLMGWTVAGSNDITAASPPLPDPPPTSTSILGNATTVTTLPDLVHPVSPTEGTHFAVISNQDPSGNDAPLTATSLSQTFTLPTGGPLSLSFNYRFLTNELNTGPSFDDGFRATLTPQGGSAITLATFDRDALQPGGSGSLTPITLSSVGGFSIGTDWLTSKIDLPAALAGRTAALTFVVYDVGDTLVNSAVTLDNVLIGAVP